jgi:signal transduction histidine kinase
VSDENYRETFEQAQETIKELREELNLTNSGFIALTLEFEQRVDQRTIELSEANDLLQQEIAERKNAEKALAEYSERLEELVEERTKDLVKAQQLLVDHEKMAILGKVAGAMARELHNPLGAIKNAAYYLKLVFSDPTPDIKETLDIIEKEVLNSTKVINNLLEFTEPRKMTRWAVNLKEIILEALYRAELPVDIVVKKPNFDFLPNILANPNQLAKAFCNIITNSVQAMASNFLSGREKTLTICVTNTGGDVITFITDTGEGIAPENMEKLYEPLFSTRAQGIGLGLPLANAVIEEHGGSIQVESQVNVGSTFSIKLPICKEKIVDLV